MVKEHIIRPADAKEYISFQFEGLVETLERFDYPSVATIVRATQAIFSNTTPDSHKAQPDCILLESFNKTK